MRFKWGCLSESLVSSSASFGQSQVQTPGPPLFALMLFPPAAHASCTSSWLLHHDIFAWLPPTASPVSNLRAFCRTWPGTLVWCLWEPASFSATARVATGNLAKLLHKGQEQGLHSQNLNENRLQPDSSCITLGKSTSLSEPQAALLYNEEILPIS